jgi:hypothetical protein
MKRASHLVVVIVWLRTLALLERSPWSSVIAASRCRRGSLPLMQSIDVGLVDGGLNHGECLVRTFR